jgi:hypothetical protein
MGFPTTGTPPQGALSKLWIATSLPFNATTALCLEFTGEGIQATKNRYYNDGIRGTRQRARERLRTVSVSVGGSVTFTPTYTELRTLLPLILGTAESGGGTSGSPYAYVLAETIPVFYLLIQKVPASDTSHTKAVQLVERCVVSRAVFSITQGGPLALTLDIEAERETFFQHAQISTDSAGNNVMSGGASAQSVPSSAPDFDACWVFGDTQGASSNFMIAGSDREAFDWTLSIDNMVDANRFTNSLYRRTIQSQDLDIQMSATLPFTTAEDELYDTIVNSASPDMNNNLIKFVNAEAADDDTLSFLIGTWNPVPRTPVVAGKLETPLPLAGPVSRKNTSTAKAPVAVNMWRSS